MNYPWQATVQDEQGNAVLNPVVTVWEADGVTLATIYDVTGAVIPNPITGSLEGFVQFWAAEGEYRIEGASGGEETEVWSWIAGVDLSGIESEISDINDRIDALSSGGVVTAVGVASVVISGDVEAINTSGYYTAGDGGGAQYRRAASEPSHAGKLQSSDGAWWELSEFSAVPEMFGAKRNGIDSDHSAIASVFNYNAAKGWGNFAELSSNCDYFVSQPVVFPVVSSKPTTFRGNGSRIRSMSGMSDHVISCEPAAATWAYRLIINDLTIFCQGVSSGVNVENCNGLVLDNVFIQGPVIGITLKESFAVTLNKVNIRNSVRDGIYVDGLAMQLKLLDCALHDCGATSGYAAIRLAGLNHNISILHSDFEGGAGSFLISTGGIDALSIQESYIEGYAQNPIYFSAACRAFQLNGSWLGYNSGTQEWINIDSAEISSNIFANQQFAAYGASVRNMLVGNNAFVQGSNAFYGAMSVPPMASGATNNGGVGYYRDISGTVHLAGLVGRSSDGQAFTLPVGFRPKVTCTYAVTTSDRAVCTAKVYVDGIVTLFLPTPASHSVDLSSVSFMAGN